MRDKVRRAVLVFLLTLFGCAADLREVFFHPDVEQRVNESLTLEARAPVAVGDTFEFAVFGDVHIGEKAGCHLEQFRGDVDSLGIDFYCVLGDITNSGSRVEFDSAHRVLNSIGRFYPTLGNHDLFSRSGWDEFKRYFGPATYAVRIGTRLKLVFFDTAEGEVGKTQFNWLEDVLDDSTAIKLVFSHFPLYDGKTPGVSRLASHTERAKLLSLLTKHRVYAYCSGHTHGFSHYQLGGVNHFICGTMSRTLDFGEPGYLLFQIRGEKVSYRYISFVR